MTCDVFVTLALSILAGEIALLSLAFCNHTGDNFVDLLNILLPLLLSFLSIHDLAGFVNWILILAILEHVKRLLASAGKKSYTFVVGKVNPAKIANFDEIGGWVVIGCWESSLIESKDFLKPLITPFELETALMRDDESVKLRHPLDQKVPAMDAQVSYAIEVLV